MKKYLQVIADSVTIFICDVIIIYWIKYFIIHKKIITNEDNFFF